MQINGPVSSLVFSYSPGIFNNFSQAYVIMPEVASYNGYLFIVSLNGLDHLTCEPVTQHINYQRYTTTGMEKTGHIKKKTMNRFIPFLLTIILLNFCSMSASSQQSFSNYETQWKRVEDFVKKGLPKSALDEVKKIYGLAKKEQQGAQIIKSLIYITELQQDNSEGNATQAITGFENEIIKSTEPAASILRSVTAELYWRYFQNNRYKFYDRTNTINFKKEDIATWTTDDLHKKIGDLYIASIKPEKILQQTTLAPFEAILVTGNTRKLRPTLYDLLAHRALDYFKNDERDITRPSYAFEINEEVAFAPANEFIKLRFTTKDTVSLHYKALLVLQDLLRFHDRDLNKDAFIDVDIERIQFVYQYSIVPDKENAYVLALTKLISQSPDQPAMDQAKYLLAQYYENLAQLYKPGGDTTYRRSRIIAKELCEKVLSRKTETEGSVNCFNLLTQINRQELQFNVEKVNIPGAPFRALINYRNFNHLFLRIIKADEKLKQQLVNYDDKFWNSLLATTPLKTWDQELPHADDLQKHGVEIKIDALPAGEYFLTASPDKNFDSKIAVVGSRLFYVSTISYVNSGSDFFVLNRDNGQPLAKAVVQVWARRYDSKQSRYINTKASSYNTDAHGFFALKTDKTETYNNNYLLDITHGGERLFLDDYLSNYYYDRENGAEENGSITTWLFTDRGIYRPGQTVFFKGIVTGKNSVMPRSEIKANYKTKIYLKDANDGEIDSINVKTNDFGSFSGKFQLPQGTLNGGFSLSMENEEGATNIQVEEYKRPLFSVAYEKVKGSYSVNDSIKLTGTAKAYAGNNIENGKVKYRIVREPRFLYPWLFRKWWQPPTQEMEIAHGEAMTDKAGQFKIGFIAIPDFSIDKKLEPVFDYKIYADVTDINGETRSAETTVSVSYKSILLQVNLATTLPADSLRSIAIRTENMSGEFEPAGIKLIITRLKEESRLIRNRYWERPDLFVMKKDEYVRYFPHDEYDHETDQDSWDKGEKVFEKTDTTKDGGLIAINSWPSRPGFYLVEVITKDKKGQEVKDEKIIELYDEKTNHARGAQYLWTEGAEAIEPGEKTTVKLASSADNLNIIQEINKYSGDGSSSNGSSLITHDYININNEKRSFLFGATEADRGGYSVSYLFVKHNRFFQTTQQIVVPWTNKDLKIEYASFRDKTLPGSAEQWKVKITGYKNEQVGAEMLASMYDASLDQFYPFEWNKPYLWPYHYSNARWNGMQNFSQVQSTQTSLVTEKTKNFQKEYDHLLSENMGFINRRARGGVMTMDMAMKAAPLAEAEVSQEIAGARIQPKNGDGELAIANLIAFDDTIAIPKPNPYKNVEIQIRKNFNETAFFFPDLRTDSTGAIEFSFTMPEALTKWKFQSFTHTKELAFGLSSKEIITQKQLMVQPNAPRFLREGDRMEFSAKIVNLTDKEVTGQAELQLFDATTNQSVDGWFQNMFPNQFFTVGAGQSEAVLFPIQVPYLFNKALTWRVIARTTPARDSSGSSLSDGEEATMPVLTNKILVTETLPLNMKGVGVKDLKFEKLSHAGESETLQHQSLSIEYTSNPVWYAVQALPYLIEYPYECAEQTWNRYFANSLGAMLVNSSPRLQQVFEKWRTTDTAALLSNLQKNQDLKSVLLEETPWVLEAKTEEQQKKNIARLFDLMKMKDELTGTVEKLKQLQLENGGFVWFKGGPDDRYITQYILTSIGHLRKLGGIADGQQSKLTAITSIALPYLDKKIKADYDYLIKHKMDLKKYVPGYTEIQFLYMRSFFPENKVTASAQIAYDFYKERIEKTWIQQGKYMQGMIALALSRSGNMKTSALILKSLKETAINNDETGMYWKNQQSGWFWYEAPIETQALLIEAFNEVGKDPATVNALKTWLLKNKQTNSWETTKSTAEACYALLYNSNASGNVTPLLSNDPAVNISLGSMQIQSTNAGPEAGTGYFRKIIPGEKVNAEMGSIRVEIKSASPTVTSVNLMPTWGSIYWQYFENSEKITGATTPLKLIKKLFVETNTDHGPVLSPFNEGDAIKVGDKIKVRIELRVDRSMEYVHMKDMRASCLEPSNVLSGYKWQGGLGYYESTKDASTNFFFDRLDKGTYVFEYFLFATHKGNFSNGITNIQCMYAPEFTSHSEGIRINVE